MLGRSVGAAVNRPRRRPPGAHQADGQSRPLRHLHRGSSQPGGGLRAIPTVRTSCAPVSRAGSGWARPPIWTRSSRRRWWMPHRRRAASDSSRSSSTIARSGTSSSSRRMAVTSRSRQTRKRTCCAWSSSRTATRRAPGSARGSATATARGARPIASTSRPPICIRRVFPLLARIAARRFCYGVAFHGFAKEAGNADIYIGGGASDSVKQAVRGALDRARLPLQIKITTATDDPKFQGAVRTT